MMVAVEVEAPGGLGMVAGRSVEALSVVWAEESVGVRLEEGTVQVASAALALLEACQERAVGGSGSMAVLAVTIEVADR